MKNARNNNFQLLLFTKKLIDYFILSFFNAKLFKRFIWPEARGVKPITTRRKDRKNYSRTWLHGKLVVRFWMFNAQWTCAAQLWKTKFLSPDPKKQVLITSPSNLSKIFCLPLDFFPWIAVNDYDGKSCMKHFICVLQYGCLLSLLDVLHHQKLRQEIDPKRGLQNKWHQILLRGWCNSWCGKQNIKDKRNELSLKTIILDTTCSIIVFNTSIYGFWFLHLLSCNCPKFGFSLY